MAFMIKTRRNTAFSICKDNHLPILVFDMNEQDSILRAVRGEAIGTLVDG